MSIFRFNIYITEDPSDIYNTHILIQTHMCTIDLHMCVTIVACIYQQELTIPPCLHRSLYVLKRKVCIYIYVYTCTLKCIRIPSARERGAEGAPSSIPLLTSQLVRIQVIDTIRIF